MGELSVKFREADEGGNKWEIHVREKKIGIDTDISTNTSFRR